MGNIFIYIRQKGITFWLLHLVWSTSPFAVACWPIKGVLFEVWAVGSIGLIIVGFFYHMHSSSVVAREAFKRLGDARSLLAEHKSIEMAAMLLREDTSKAERHIMTARNELLQQFKEAARHIRFSWLYMSVLPAFIVTLGMSWWFWYDTSSIWGALAALVSFFLFTVSFFMKSTVMLADGLVESWNDQNM